MKTNHMQATQNSVQSMKHKENVILKKRTTVAKLDGSNGAHRLIQRVCNMTDYVSVHKQF
jgi:hypothetical protein